MMELIESLSGDEKLKELDLSSKLFQHPIYATHFSKLENSICDDEARSISSMIYNTSSLETLNLSGKYVSFFLLVLSRSNR